MQKIIQYYLLIASFGFAGCVSFSARKPASGWYVLEKSTDVRCRSWPKRDKDLAIGDVTVIKGKTPGFLVTGMRRDGGPMHYFAPFSGSTRIDPDSFIDLKLGRGAVVAGGELSPFGKPVVNVLRNASKLGGDEYSDAAAVQLELRALPKNLVRGNVGIGRFHAVEGLTTPVNAGGWVVIKAEDHTYHLAFVDLTKKASDSIRLVAGGVWSERPIILPIPGQRAAHVIWKQAEGSKPFRLQIATPEGGVSAASGLDAVVSSQVEGWDAISDGNGLYLSWVDGDSLVGQAGLKVAKFGLAKTAAAARIPTWQWTRELPLMNVHVADPIFRRGANSVQDVEVMLLNWIDEESTIARYKVASGMLGEPGYAGVFAKGTRVISVFGGEEAEGTDDLYVLTRHKDGDTWSFQLCEI